MTTRSAVLDACVLANFSLCDTLLRLAEPPGLFSPKWSDDIIVETIRTLESKLRWPQSLTAHFESELRAHFSEAWIHGYDELIPRMTNHWKDRHVLAAAAHANVGTILTFNLRDFQAADLDSWAVRVLHPQSFLIELWRESPGEVLLKLDQQASDRNREVGQLLQLLRHTVPDFVDAVLS